MQRLFVFLAAASWACLPATAQIFEVPGHAREMKLLEDLFRKHRVLGPDTTLWDPWIPMSILGWQTSEEPSTESLRRVYRERLLNRRITPDGYVSTQQHEGLAHGEGWPFPLWTQAGGAGWHFTVRGLPYGEELGVRPAQTVDDWSVAGARTVALDREQGWSLELTNSHATITSPPVDFPARVAPFLRLKAATRGLEPATVAWIDWQLQGQTNFASTNCIEIPLAGAASGPRDINAPLSLHPGWTGRVARLRLRFARVKPGAQITLQRFFTAIDSRHNVNNAAYLQACDDYARWTGDIGFVRENIQRMRLALAWALNEFDIAERHVVVTPWTGHDGRSGHSFRPNGERALLPGVGVGNNYWDLLPFGGEDALATIYYFDAIRRMAALEHQIARHPEWNIPGGPLRFDPSELLTLSREVQAAANERFWNETTGRFVGWRDLQGNAHDYGFTFVNNEAIYFGLADPSHARAIRDWIDGRRIVTGDTATGPDIFFWRFGPRATTRRNVETYLWAWSDPASIPWGGQVQDGGAVLGFSYHDLMARLAVNGPNDAWQRLREILNWFAEVQQAGGYREYYKDPARGTLQGGGTAGGLGLDHEFFESVLPPQVMLYGFLGFHPRMDGCHIAPRLPDSWPSLTVRGIALHDVVLNVTATAQTIRMEVQGEPARPLRLHIPGAVESQVDLRPGTLEIALKDAPAR